MQINATLIGQALAFLILIAFTWKFVWPPLLGAIETRQKKIAEGLAAADRGQQDLENAKNEALAIVREAHGKATQIVDLRCPASLLDPTDQEEECRGDDAANAMGRD